MNHTRQMNNRTTIGLISAIVSILIVSCGNDDRPSRLPAIESESASSYVITESPSATNGGGAPAQQGDAQPQDRPAVSGTFGVPDETRFFADAAEKLGIALDKLVEALGNPPDIQAAAEKLGIPVNELRGALPEFFQGDLAGGPGGVADAGRIGGQLGGQLAAAFEEAAGKLEVSVDALMEALGREFDLEAAAARLETTVEALREALPAELIGRMEGGFRGQGRGQQ